MVRTISNKSRVNPNYLSWKTGVFKFENTPLDEAITHLNAFYDNPIVSETDLKECAVTGVFNNQKIEEIIEALALSCNLEFSKKNNKFILK